MFGVMKEDMPEIKCVRAAVLCQDIVPKLRMAVTEFAGKLGVSRHMMHGILAERHAVTPRWRPRIGQTAGQWRWQVAVYAAGARRLAGKRD